MKYEYIARALSEPALITETAHLSLQQLFLAHVAGGAMPLKAEEGESDSAQAQLPDAPPAFAVVWLKGPMMQYASGLDELCAGVVSTSKVRNQLRQAAENPDVHTIFLMIDSPGGQVAGTMETGDLVRRISGQKNVVCMIVGQACSAAYWVASQCTVVVSQPSSILGSIGAYMARLDDSEYLEKKGMKWDVFRAGKHKAAGLGRPFTPEERAQYQNIATQAHEDFKAAVLAVRDIPLDALEGQPFTAKDALALNLVDALVMDVAEFMRSVIEDPNSLSELV